GFNPCGWNNGNPEMWNRFKRTLSDIKDGTSNTVLVGTKALAIQAYDNRGEGSFFMSNGATRDKRDSTIASGGIHPRENGMFRWYSPDTHWNTADHSRNVDPINEILYDDYLPGESFPIHENWKPWYINTFGILQDALDIDVNN